MTSTQRTRFGIGILLPLDCGSLQGLQPHLLGRIDIPFGKPAVMAFAHLCNQIPGVVGVKAHHVPHEIAPGNFASVFGAYLVAGDLLIHLGRNFRAEYITRWCHGHDVLYLDTAVKRWDRYADIDTRYPTERMQYARHLALRKMGAMRSERRPTAIPTEWTTTQRGASPFDEFFGLRRSVDARQLSNLLRS